MARGPPSESELRQLHLKLENANAGTLSPEELRSLLSSIPGLLVETIFGFGEDGWMENCAERPSRERDSLMHLMGPTGPLFRLLQSISLQPSSFESWMFEFPFANLPDHARRATLATVQSAGPAAAFSPHGYAEPPRLHPQEENSSWLSSFILPRLQGIKERGVQGAYIIVNAVEYFILCLTAAPVWKGISPLLSGAYSSFKSKKRSSSLPSRRALYNFLLTLYLNHFLPHSQSTGFGAALHGNLPGSGDHGELFIRAMVDYWFTPPPASPGSPTSHLGWIPRIEVAEAVAQLAVHLSPKDVQENVQSFGSGSLSTSEYSTGALDISRARTALHPQMTQFYDMGFTVAPWSKATDVAPFVALLRGWSVTAIPWNRAASTAVGEKTLPKKKKPPAGPAQGVAGMGSVVALAASAWEHVPTLSFDSGGTQLGQVGTFAGWEPYAETRSEAILMVLPNLLAKAAFLRIGSVPDGADALQMLASTLGAPGVVALLVKERERLELNGWRPSAHNLWQSLQDLVQQMDDVTRRRSSTADSLRRGPSNSVLLSPLSKMFGLPPLPTWSYMQHVQALRNHASWIGSVGCLETAKAHRILREGIEASGEPEAVRRQLFFGERVCTNRDVPFVGGPWDTPIRGDEIWLLVQVGYWISMQVERRWGWKLNLRFIGSYSFVLLVSVLAIAIMVLGI